ncbi:DDIT3 protein, partial [Todus mexicanus]|nr:DDIT3 protein [Todus mexicanus]
MAAGGLPAGGPAWELEAWYQDLQEVLAAAEPGEPFLPWGAEQVSPAPRGTRGCELDAALGAEPLEPARTAGTEPAGLPGSAFSSSPPSLGTEEDEATSGASAGRGGKRKRGSDLVASRELAKRRERASEQRVLELTAHNQRLREEIERLSAEVERTRAALIDRIVNLRRA